MILATVVMLAAAGIAWFFWKETKEAEDKPDMLLQLWIDECEAQEKARRFK